MFKGTSYYTPLAFINLIGNTDSDLKTYYKNILLNTSNIIIENDYKELKTNVIDFISNTNKVCDNIINEAQIERSYNIDEFLKITLNTNSFTYRNVIEPDANLIKIINSNTSLFKLEHSYKICKKLYDALEKKLKNNDSKEYDDIVDNITDVIKIKSTYLKKKEDYDKARDLLFKILKKASNICFSGENDYSKNYVLYTLNSGKGSDLTGYKYTPFKFNLDFNKPDTTIKTKKEEIIKIEEEKIQKVINDSSKCDIKTRNDEKGGLDGYIDDIRKKECPQSKYEWPDPISYVTTFLYMFLIFFIIYIILVLSDIFGYYIISGFNIFFIYIKNTIYGILNTFRGKYDPPDYDLKKSKRNLSNIVRRLAVVRNAINK
jgi:hypothetical protein